jgi:hypothetical protein
MAQSCRTCKFWDIDKAKSPTGRVRAYVVAPCLYGGLPKLPESCEFFNRRKNPLRFMAHTYGGLCETYVKRLKEST